MSVTIIERYVEMPVLSNIEKLNHESSTIFLCPFPD